MAKGKQMQLIERDRFVGIRFTPGEFERLEAANAKRKEGWREDHAKGHMGSLSGFIRDQLREVIATPAARVQVRAKPRRSAAMKPRSVKRRGRRKPRARR